MDLKSMLAPVLKVVDQLDTQSVLAISGVMFVLTGLFGGFADVIALAIGVVMGFALYKKLML